MSLARPGRLRVIPAIAAVVLGLSCRSWAVIEPDAEKGVPLRVSVPRLDPDTAYALHLRAWFAGQVERVLDEDASLADALREAVAAGTAQEPRVVVLPDPGAWLKRHEHEPVGEAVGSMAEWWGGQDAGRRHVQSRAVPREPYGELEAAALRVPMGGGRANGDGRALSAAPMYFSLAAEPTGVQRSSAMRWNAGGEPSAWSAWVTSRSLGSSRDAAIVSGGPVRIEAGDNVLEAWNTAVGSAAMTEVMFAVADGRHVVVELDPSLPDPMSWAPTSLVVPTVWVPQVTAPPPGLSWQDRVMIPGSWASWAAPVFAVHEVEGGDEATPKRLVVRPLDSAETGGLVLIVVFETAGPGEIREVLLSALTGE